MDTEKYKYLLVAHTRSLLLIPYKETNTLLKVMGMAHSTEVMGMAHSTEVMGMAHSTEVMGMAHSTE